MKHRVEPGLYALGNATANSPVFVSANYTLSFDALRQALAGREAWIVVLDTAAINVWCAAGEGTFGTDELVRRVEETDLKQVVSHRTLILPQLGAPGIRAHEVKRRIGFKVEYGPVRATDLSEYLKSGRASPEMRRVRFGLRERLALVPVEVVGAIFYLVPVAVAAYLAGGWMSVLMAVAAVFVGTLAFPILLPWLPAKTFSGKGFFLGGIVLLPFPLAIFLGRPGDWAFKLGFALANFLVFVAATAFLALGFTGSTTFTSRSAVKREIYRYFPVMAWMLGGGVILTIVMTLVALFGSRS
jgi:uncharacterized membrane protein YiaA